MTCEQVCPPPPRRSTHSRRYGRSAQGEKALANPISNVQSTGRENWPLDAKFGAGDLREMLLDKRTKEPAILLEKQLLNTMTFILGAATVLIMYLRKPIL